MRTCGAQQRIMYRRKRYEEKDDRLDRSRGSCVLSAHAFHTDCGGERGGQRRHSYNAGRSVVLARDADNGGLRRPLSGDSCGAVGRRCLLTDEHRSSCSAAGAGSHVCGRQMVSGCLSCPSQKCSLDDPDRTGAPRACLCCQFPALPGRDRRGRAGGCRCRRR